MSDDKNPHIKHVGEFLIARMFAQGEKGENPDIIPLGRAWEQKNVPKEQQINPQESALTQQSKALRDAGDRQVRHLEALTGEPVPRLSDLQSAPIGSARPHMSLHHERAQHVENKLKIELKIAETLLRGLKRVFTGAILCSTLCAVTSSTDSVAQQVSAKPISLRPTSTHPSSP